MTGTVTTICVVLALLLAAVAAYRVYRNTATTRGDLLGAGAVELAVLVYVVVRAVDLAGGHRTSGAVIVVVYLVALALVMPVAAVLSYLEPSRWGAVVLAVGALVVCALLGRVAQLWSPVG